MLSRLRALEPSNRHRPHQRVADGRGRLGGRGVTGGGERRCGRCRRDGDLDLEFHPNPLFVLLIVSQVSNSYSGLIRKLLFQGESLDFFREIEILEGLLLVSYEYLLRSLA